MDFVRGGVVLSLAVLIAYSVALLALVIERVVTFRRTRRAQATEYAALREKLAAGDATGFRADAARGVSPGAFALRAGFDALPVPAEAFREAVGQEVTARTAALQNPLTYLGTIASTAPYIGLFGTVLGILSAFKKIAESGETGAAVVAGGISEALISTAIGLGVAIPAVIAYNQLLSQANALSLEVETHALGLAARYAAGTDTGAEGAK
jgi:biopolymer transport protein ExbB/TolQ